MDRRILTISLISLSLAACSNVETRKQAKGDFDYVNIKSSKELQLPEGLEKPAENTLYSIPEVNNQGPVGKRVDVRAPALVLPLASGSRIDEFDKTAAIWFDKVDDDRDLRELLIKAISDYLSTEEVTFTSEDLANNVWESDWFHVEEESGYLFWSSIDLTESWRFRYSLITKPHGRSVGLNVELIDYMHTSDKGSTKKIDPIEQQRVEMAMINAITSQLDYQYRLNNRDDRIARANMEIVTLGESDKGEPALIIDYPIDELWRYMPGFFEQYNFKVTDLNEDKYFYDVEYTLIEPSLWDSIWGDEMPVVNFKDGPYRFKLTAKGKQTTLVIQDDDKQVLSKELLEENFEVLDPALSFR
ncbi:outer membrane protein assembly factor BamC [Thalassotalea nanhaiensis]|uniref:Outer membrane protein assembly factor BamC n=1 Tax=Thalassotalea nanhaiensis TaxID=3065648 RepID=A0ABY9TNL9_9GAMM|nr:outer membrane protein assembly factor BamC [Colwelliaceae bacterium SQ345]